MKDSKNLGKGTRAVHAGVEPDPSTGAIMTPIFQTSTYVQEAVGVHKGWEYSRSHNPTRAALEGALAEIESGTHGLAFASGLAAIDCVLKTLKPGDEVIAGQDLYGGTARLFRANYAPDGELSFILLTPKIPHWSKQPSTTKPVWCGWRAPRIH